MPCSVTALVGAIEQADTAPGSTLSLAQGCTYSISAGDFTNGTNGPDALPPITAAMTVDGNSAMIQRVSATNTFRLMELADPHAADVVTISDLEFFNGDDASNPTGPSTADHGGGAILNKDAGTVTLTGDTFQDNESNGNGGAIDTGDGTGGSMTITDSLFLANQVDAQHYSGGAIDNSDDSGSSSLTVTNTTFRVNAIQQHGDGGAIDNADDHGTGPLIVKDSTFDSNGNNAANSDGGAIDNADDSGTASTVIEDSTFYENSLGASSDGGAIDNGDNSGNGTLTVVASTFDGDVADGTDSVDSGQDSGTGAVALIADMLASAGNGCSHAGGTFASVAYNLMSDLSCATAGGTANAVDPDLSSELSTLGPYGGPTQTVAPIMTNPGVAEIPNNTTETGNGTQYVICPTSGGTDQRGAPRPAASGDSCDLGAFEGLQESLLGATTQLNIVGLQPSSTEVGTSYPVEVQVEDASGNLVTASDAPVTIAITHGTGSPGAQVGCTPTSPVDATAGIAAFTCSISAPGSGFTLTASSPGLASSIGQPVQIFGPATQIAFSGEPPADPSIGASFATDVAIEDAAGNVVRASSAPAALAITTGTGTAGAALSCPANGDPTSTGRATLSCSIGTGGVGYTLTATSTGLTSGVSSRFNVGPVYTLTVSKQGTGAGTVSSTPSGISCGSTCSASFAGGAVVALTPTAATGSTFAGWSGACTGTGSCHVAMSADEQVTATFNRASPPAKPSCKLTPKSGKTSGMLKLTVRCTETVSARLTGTITEVRKGKRKRATISAMRAHAVADKSLTVTVKLPKKALSALKAGAKESAAFKLTATNSAGTATATASIKRLTLAKATKKPKK